MAFAGSAQINAILATAAPLLLAVLGETITERAGVINLSLNGVILLAAMIGFAVSSHTGSVLVGFIAGAVVGGSAGWLVSWAAIRRKASQVAVGFALMVLCRDLAYFCGAPLMGTVGPRVPHWPVPYLKKIPVVGEIFFDQDPVTYVSWVVLAVVSWWMYQTRPGLLLRGLGENPRVVYVRGHRVHALQYAYAVLGGALVGLAGPAYSLHIKAGWMGAISGLDGLGWVALAIVVFGGWNPCRAAFGVYLFTTLQWLSLVLQPRLTQIPSQVLQVIPFPLMILALLVVNWERTEWAQRKLAHLPERWRRLFGRFLGGLRSVPPAFLGRPFSAE